jgi:2-desacetyl-2-hydroxyethyl bacteriochlorophyllide A dehydrogenase
MHSYPMAVVTQPGKIEFRDRDLPEISPHGVLVQVKAAAICGSDLHIFKGKHPSAPLPAAIGHELAGQVLSVGREVTRVKEGDRVTIEPVLACGVCEFCRRGSYHLCTQISFQYRQGQGGFAPFFVVNEDRTFILPPGMTCLEGALVEPLSVALHAVKKSGISFGQSAAIFGAGAIGLLTLLLAKRAAGGRMFITDIHPMRLQKALELGAYRSIDNRLEDAVQVILDETEQLGVDRSFEAVGIETTLVQSLKTLKKGGVATLLGIFENPQVQLPANIFMQREITLSGSQGYNWDFQDSLTLLENGAIDLKPLITHRFALERLQEGFETLLDPACGAVKVVIEIA